MCLRGYEHRERFGNCEALVTDKCCTVREMSCGCKLPKRCATSFTLARTGHLRLCAVGALVPASLHPSTSFLFALLSSYCFLSRASCGLDDLDHDPIDLLSSDRLLSCLGTISS